MPAYAASYTSGDLTMGSGTTRSLFTFHNYGALESRLDLTSEGHEESWDASQYRYVDAIREGLHGNVALHLEHPTSIQATGPGVDDHACTTGVLVTYHFDRRGAMPPVKVMWYDGGLRPPYPMDLNPDDSKNRLGEGGNGVLFVGDKGYITAAGWSGMPRLLPLSLHTSYQRPEKTIPRVKGHHADWLQACKGGKQASSNFEYAARLTEIVLLGNVALRSRKVLLWDGPNMKATNHPDADKFLKEEYRKGWEIPA